MAWYKTIDKGKKMQQLTILLNVIILNQNLEYNVALMKIRQEYLDDELGVFVSELSLNCN